MLQQGYGYALSLTQHTQLAEDILQTALCSVLKKSPHNINKTYLYTAIRNTYFNQYKREKIVPMQSLGDDEDLLILEQQWHDNDWVEYAQDLDKALAKLRSMEREVMYLALVEEFSASEIAKHTDLSRGTILSLMYRAKQKLRSYLTASTGEEQA